MSLGGRPIEVEFDLEKVLENLIGARGYWGGSLVEYPLESLDSMENIDDELTQFADELEDYLLLHIFSPTVEDDQLLGYNSSQFFTPDTIELRESGGHNDSIPGIAPVYKRDILTVSEAVDQIWDDYEVVANLSADFKPIGFNTESIPKGTIKARTNEIESELEKNFPTFVWYNFDTQKDVTDVVRFRKGDVEVESHHRNQVKTVESQSAGYFENLSQFYNPFDPDIEETSRRLNNLYYTEPHHKREEDLAEEFESLFTDVGPTEPEVVKSHETNIKDY